MRAHSAENQLQAVLERGLRRLAEVGRDQNAFDDNHVAALLRVALRPAAMPALPRDVSEGLANRAHAVNGVMVYRRPISAAGVPALRAG